MRNSSLLRRLNRQKKKKRVRKKVFGTTERPRLTVFRSTKHIYAQLVDDSTRTTLMGTSSLSKSLQDSLTGKKKTEIANLVGRDLAEKAKNKNITQVIFDRGGYLYHGRVKALADGAREGGLLF